MSAIEWTDETWNPVTGCDRCSPGCDRCYIERTVPFRIEGRRFDEHGRMGIRLHPDRLDKPLHWRKPRRVFVNSLSDLFHRDVPSEFIYHVFHTMAKAPQHTFQVLTKRPQRMHGELTLGLTGQYIGRLTLPNVWLGTSVENQRFADLRIPHLLATPAAVRFLSCEPLLGPIDLIRWLKGGFGHVAPDLHWVIVGGESGPGARPMHPDWARSLRDQCEAAGVPFFFKQWGEWLPLAMREELCLPPSQREWRRYDDPGDDIAAVRVGKKTAGRELDGRTWDEMPERAA